MSTSFEQVSFELQEDTTKKLDLINEYVKTLPSQFDSFFEDELLFKKENCFLSVNSTEETIGFFITNKTKTIIHNYYLKENFSLNFPSLKRKIFEEFVKKFGIDSCFVYSIDHCFLSLLYEYQKSISVQGCAPFVYNYNNNFQQKKYIGKDQRFHEYRLEIIEETESNIYLVTSIIDGETYFIGKEEVLDMIQKRRLYFFYNEKGEIVGIGVLQKSEVLPNVWSIGMLIKKEFRSIGLGTLILVKLQEICLLNDKVAMSGCAYSNQLSRKTIEKSSGCLKGFVLEVKL